MYKLFLSILFQKPLSVGTLVDVSSGVALGLTVGILVSVGFMLGLTVGVSVTVGFMLGLIVGVPVTVGFTLGLIVGAPVTVGFMLGLIVGMPVTVGFMLGLITGIPVTVGIILGIEVGFIILSMLGSLTLTIDDIILSKEGFETRAISIGASKLSRQRLDESIFKFQASVSEPSISILGVFIVLAKSTGYE